MKEFNFQESSITDGAQPARVARIVDIGVQPPIKNAKFDNGPQRQLSISFELSEDKVNIGGEDLPAFVSMRVNVPKAYSKRAKLVKLAKALGFGEGTISYAEMIGKPLLLTLENKRGSDDVVRARITDFAALPKSMLSQIPELHAQGYFFDFDSPSEAILEVLGDGTKKILKNAENFAGSKLAQILELSEVPSNEEEV